MLVGCSGSPAARHAPTTARAGARSPHTFPIEGTDATWPLSPEVDPALAEMPRSAQGSIEGVADYLREHERGELALVRALHEWVASRIRYDDARPAWEERAALAPANGDELLSRLFSRQNGDGALRLPALSGIGANTYDERALWAADAMKTRRGVCADYAALLELLGARAGVDIRYVRGPARWADDDGIAAELHAWNVAFVDGHAYLLDATWDAGTGSGTTFARAFQTDYLFTPPDVFAYSHFPQDPSDLHTSAPLTREAFMARPLLEPRFFVLGLSFLSQRASRDAAHLLLSNPLGATVLAEVKETGVASKRCDVSGGERVEITCLRSAGASAWVRVWAGAEHRTRASFVAMFDVTRPS